MDMKEHYQDRIHMNERIIRFVADLAKKSLIQRFVKEQALALNPIPEPPEQNIDPHLDQQRKLIDKRLQDLDDNHKSLLRGQILEHLQKTNILIKTKKILIEEIDKLELACKQLETAKMPPPSKIPSKSKVDQPPLEDQNIAITPKVESIDGINPNVELLLPKEQYVKMPLPKSYTGENSNATKHLPEKRNLVFPLPKKIKLEQLSPEKHISTFNASKLLPEERNLVLPLPKKIKLEPLSPEKHISTFNKDESMDK